MEKEENQSVYKEALEVLMARLQSAEKFVLSELPIVCQQIVAEREVEEKFDLITSGAMAAVALAVTLYLGFACSDYVTAGGNEGRAALSGIASLITGIFSLVSTGCTLAAVRNLLSLKAAPKLYILNQLRRLIR